MVIMMNKTEFVNELTKNLSYSYDKCLTICNILENSFFISKREKERIIDDFIQKLNVSKKEALEIYDTSITILKNEIKSKLKHPFKSWKSK